jgi:hypothetical protein
MIVVFLFQPPHPADCSLSYIIQWFVSFLWVSVGASKVGLGYIPLDMAGMCHVTAFTTYSQGVPLFPMQAVYFGEFFSHSAELIAELCLPQFVPLADIAIYNMHRE